MCIFCKIINNEIPSKTIYEDDDFKAILDISQATFGHTIVLTKKHFDNIFEVDDETASKYLVVVKKVAKLILEKTGATGINLLNNNGVDAGQSVNHVHIHIIPRYPDDNITIKTVDNSDKINLDDVYNKIIK